MWVECAAGDRKGGRWRRGRRRGRAGEAEGGGGGPWWEQSRERGGGHPGPSARRVVAATRSTRRARRRASERAAARATPPSPVETVSPATAAAGRERGDCSVVAAAARQRRARRAQQRTNLDVEALQRRRRAVNRVLLHVLRHVRVLNDSLALRLEREGGARGRRGGGARGRAGEAGGRADRGAGRPVDSRHCHGHTGEREGRAGGLASAAACVTASRHPTTRAAQAHNCPHRAAALARASRGVLAVFAHHFAAGRPRALSLSIFSTLSSRPRIDSRLYRVHATTARPYRRGLGGDAPERCLCVCCGRERVVPRVCRAGRRVGARARAARARARAQAPARARADRAAA